MTLGPLKIEPAVTEDTPDTQLLVAVRDAICRALTDLGLEEDGRGISLQDQQADAAFMLGSRVIDVSVNLGVAQPDLPRAA